MTLKFLQINLGRGREAQDLMTQKATEENTDILLISEPYRRPPSQTWYEDSSNRAAIMIRNVRLTVHEVNENNTGFVYATIGRTRIYSCYFSPNMEYDQFVAAISNLEASIRSFRHRVIIGGDFNSKSPEWNSNILDNRGITLCETIASLNLTVFNVGDKLTFRRGAGGSIIDITFGSGELCNGNMNWVVLEDLTLSDHQYITFKTYDNTTVTQDETALPRWNVRKLDEAKLLEHITRTKARNQYNQIDNTNAENATDTLIKIIRKACNVGMPRIRKYANKSPVYWWNEEIRQLRTKCLAARRASTRNHENQVLLDEYRRSRKSLRSAIKESKRKCWIDLCKEIDDDPWGKPYKITMKKLGTMKPIPGIRKPEWATTIVETLFPYDMDGLKGPNILNVDVFASLNRCEVTQACGKLKKGKSPGPDGIPNEVIQLVGEIWPELLTSVFNTCLLNGSFPIKWKIQKLVLLRKGDKPLDVPSSYRPLCMLDSMGKLFESILLQRLEECVQSLGGLSPMQFGFRKGRSTIDAINEVVNMAEQAKTAKGFCAVITLDVQNAFNSAKWNTVLEALRTKGVDNYLYNIVADYLNNRILLYETEHEMKEYRITAGVPQGSVLGPFLWNVMYDGLLNMELQYGAKLIGYADDIALVVSQQESELVEIIANDSLSRCSRWLGENGLQLAVAKTEAILITDRRKFKTPNIAIENNEIHFRRSLRYLGVQLDDKLSFSSHINIARNKAMRTATSLARIMPNCGGPRPQIRMLINSVVHSQLLYAAPAFSRTMKFKERRKELQKPQRISALRIISAYRTVSTCAALVLAGLPPIDLLVLEREEIYTQTKRVHSEEHSPAERNRYITEMKVNARNNLITKWQERWNQEENGRWTYRLIPDIKTWMERRHGNMGYFLTQVMTDHGSLNKYLHRFKIRSTSNCDSCGALQEDAEHILFECGKWSAVRFELNNKLGTTLTPDNMVPIMLRSRETWKYCEMFVNKIMKVRCIGSEPPTLEIGRRT